MTNPDHPSLLTVNDLTVRFPVRQGFEHRHVHAVERVSFALERGRTLGLVGESGSGKTTVGRSLLGLLPTAKVLGKAMLGDTDILSVRHSHRRRAITPRMQMIFQDPAGSLNPRMTIGNIIAEPLRCHRRQASGNIWERVSELLTQVGLSPAYASRYPHEFSGGQRQRIGIARAIALQPDIVICDEPVSALDVSIQAQILNLLKDLQDQLGLSYLFIAHNLAVVRHFADDVAVMYLGRIVERAPADHIMDIHNVRHPYTRSLLASIPLPDPTAHVGREPLTGEMPSPIAPPTGCAFHPRCPLARKVASTLRAEQTLTITSGDQQLTLPRSCVDTIPTLEPVSGESHHTCACHFASTPQT
jgi:oligopeptide transport system ATP-binding protein